MEIRSRGKLNTKDTKYTKRGIEFTKRISFVIFVPFVVNFSNRMQDV